MSCLSMPLIRAFFTLLFASQDYKEKAIAFRKTVVDAAGASEDGGEAAEHDEEGRAQEEGEEGGDGAMDEEA